MFLTFIEQNHGLWTALSAVGVLVLIGSLANFFVGMNSKSNIRRALSVIGVALSISLIYCESVLLYIFGGGS